MKFKLLIFLLVPCVMQGQLDISLSTLGGKENNINRSPNSWIEEDSLLEGEELYMNSIYQDIRANIKFKKRWKKSTLKLEVDPRHRSYFQEPDLNLSSIRSSINYKIDFSKKLQWENELNRRRDIRNGENFDEIDLGLPLGYQISQLSSGLHFRLAKMNRSHFKIKMGRKIFDPSDVRQVRYNLFGASYTWKNIKWKNHLLHYYGFNASYTARKFELEYVEDDSVAHRNWNYLNVGIFIKHPLNEKWSLKPSLDFLERIDASENRFGYKQIEPAVECIYKYKRFYMKTKIRYTQRNFQNFIVAEVNENLQALRYDFFRFNTYIRYSMSKRLDLIADCRVINRKSNNEKINSLAYRSYISNYFGLGIRWKTSL